MKMLLSKFILYSGAIGLLTLGACTKFANPDPRFEEYGIEQDSGVKRKVLVIAVDGLVGNQIKEYAPTNISKMQQNAKYSYEAMADENTGSSASWSTLLTGYPSAVHHINNESFIPEVDPSHPHGDIKFAPSLIYRIEEVNRRMKTAAVSRNPVMSNILLSNADNSSVEDSDEAVVVKAKDYLKNNDPDFLLVQLSGLIEGGENGGFLIANPNYKAALDLVDEHIGELLSAVETGEDYENQDWLIVITSPHGGDSDGNYGGTTPEEMLTYSLYYNKKFQSAEIKGESMLSHRIYGNASGTYGSAGDGSAPSRTFTLDNSARARTPEGSASDMFKISTTGELTIDMKMKVNPDNYWAGFANSGGYTFWYSPVFGKTVGTAVGNIGWTIRFHNLNFAIRLQDGVGDNQAQSARRDGEWFHFTLVFKGEENNTKTRVIAYINGSQAVSELKDASPASLDSDAPFNLGYIPYGSNLYAVTDINVADVRAWNKALTADEALEVSCLQEITESNALYSHLFAHYGKEMDGKYIWKNDITKVGAAPDLTFEGNPQPMTVENFATCVDRNPAAIFQQTYDLLPQVFYWLNLETKEDWDIPGKVFLNKFLAEFWEG